MTERNDGNCLLYIVAGISFWCWIFFAFTNIRTWIIGIFGLLVAILFSSICEKEYDRSYFSFSYLVGFITSLLVGMWVSNVARWQMILSAIFMPMVFPFVIAFYRVLKEVWKQKKMNE